MVTTKSYDLIITTLSKSVITDPVTKQLFDDLIDIVMHLRDGHASIIRELLRMHEEQPDQRLFDFAQRLM